MSKGARHAKPTRSTRTIKNLTYIPSQPTQKHNHLKSLQWTSSQSFPCQKDTTQSSRLQTTTVPKPLCSFPVTKPSRVKGSQSYIFNPRTHTTAFPKD